MSFGFGEHQYQVLSISEVKSQKCIAIIQVVYHGNGSKQASVTLRFQATNALFPTFASTRPGSRELHIARSKYWSSTEYRAIDPIILLLTHISSVYDLDPIDHTYIIPS